MPLLRRISWLLLSTLLFACGETKDDQPAEPPLTPYLAADGVTITRLSVYQGLERDLMNDGAAGSLGGNIPLIGGRDALLRVYYTTDTAYDGNTVLTRVTITDNANSAATSGGGGGGGGMAPNGNAPVETVIETTGALYTLSAHDDLASTVNIDVPGALITPTSSLRVEFLRARAQSTGTNTKAAYPAENSLSLPVNAAGGKVRIVLVPVLYNSDGSGRLPDVSASQLKLYRDTFWKLYPVSEVELRVAEPFEWKGIAILGTGQGWGELLNAFVGHRQASKAAFDEYYYAIFRANDTFEAFCGQGCIAGLSLLSDNPFNDAARAGIGLGFSGEGATQTAAHEIGHEHGRGHVPCGTSQGIDPGYPHADGAIGGWGYDLVKKELVRPETKDFMSYCDPKWVSDFTYSALLLRSQQVNGAMMNWIHAPGAPATQRYERVALLPNGKVEWLEPFELERPPIGLPEPVQFDGLAPAANVPGQFFPYSHLPGGVVFFPASKRVERIRLRNRLISR